MAEVAQLKFDEVGAIFHYHNLHRHLQMPSVGPSFSIEDLSSASADSESMD